MSVSLKEVGALKPVIPVTLVSLPILPLAKQDPLIEMCRTGHSHSSAGDPHKKARLTARRG